MPLNTIEGTRFELTPQGRIIEIMTDEVVQLFRGVTLKAPDIAANEFGIWNIASVGNKGEIKYTSFRQPRHILQARNGCVWNPKMKFTQVGGKLILSPYTVNGEICPDAFWDNIFEKIFGTGLAIRDIYATPEGRALIDELLSKVFAAMHNGFYDVSWYGAHPLVDASLENNYFPGDAGQYADFVDQMSVSDGGGILTQLDGLRDAGGYEHLEGDFAGGDITDDEFTGGSNNITTYLDTLYSQATTDLQTVKDTEPSDFRILAHPAEFDALQDYYIATYGDIPAVYQYHVTGKDGSTQIDHRVLKYKGSPVIRMNGWKRFDTETGYNMHRLVACTSGLFGNVFDTRDVPSRPGVAMRIDQRLGGGEGFMGKAYILSDFKHGVEVLDHNFASMITLVDTP